MFHLLTILMFFNLVSGSCCQKGVLVDGNEGKDKNTAYAQRINYFGYYTMEAGFVNGKSHFLKYDDKNKAIWWVCAYTNSTGRCRGRWIVGETDYLGQIPKYGLTFYVDTEAECPYTPGYSWRYRTQWYEWRDAGNGFTIHDYYCQAYRG